MTGDGAQAAPLRAHRLTGGKAMAEAALDAADGEGGQ